MSYTYINKLPYKQWQKIIISLHGMPCVVFKHLPILHTCKSTLIKFSGDFTQRLDTTYQFQILEINKNLTIYCGLFKTWILSLLIHSLG